MIKHWQDNYSTVWLCPGVQSQKVSQVKICTVDFDKVVVDQSTIRYSLLKSMTCWLWFSSWWATLCETAGRQTESSERNRPAENWDKRKMTQERPLKIESSRILNLENKSGSALLWTFSLTGTIPEDEPPTALRHVLAFGEHVNQSVLVYFSSPIYIYIYIVPLTVICVWAIVLDWKPVKLRSEINAVK